VQSVLVPCYAVDCHMGKVLKHFVCLTYDIDAMEGYVCSSLTDIVRSMLRLQTNTDCIPQHQYHMINIQSVLAPCYVVDGHMGPPLHCYTCAARGAWWFLDVWLCVKPMQWCKIMSEALYQQHRWLPTFLS
jgi:hypothetical protein